MDKEIKLYFIEIAIGLNIIVFGVVWLYCLCCGLHYESIKELSISSISIIIMFFNNYHLDKIEDKTRRKKKWIILKSNIIQD